MIPYGHQSINEQDIAAVTEVLRSDWLTQGPAIPRFERAVAEYCNAKHAVAVCNGTAALHLACLTLGLSSGDILWTSPITFVASANCALYCGADIDFVDIDSETFNMSIDALKDKLREAERLGKLPKIVIPVHFAGQSCDMKEIHNLAEKYGFYIIEDACHALGGSYCDAKIGSCHYSDMTVFSFHPVKIITSGEGGMILTNNSKLAKKLTILRSHGITRDENLMTAPPEGGWYYQQLALGYNYRITDIQAALGLSQMQRVDEFVDKRHELADRYNNSFINFPLSSQQQFANSYSAYHLYVVWLHLNKLKKSRSEIFAILRELNVGVNVHYIPVHLQPWYKKFGFVMGDFPNAEKYYAGTLTLPLYPTLSSKQQDFIIHILGQVLE